MHKLPLETERLIIRNWEEQDRDLFHLINSDERVMEFFAIRRTKEESDKMMDEVKLFIDKNGRGLTAIALKESNEAIGFCALADAEMEDARFTGEIEIGWRLAPRFWGKGYVTEAARRLLEFGFTELQLPGIVSFAVPKNKRSIAVMKRLGMTRDPSSDFDHSKVPDTHAELKRHVVYRILPQKEEF